MITFKNWILINENVNDSVLLNIEIESNIIPVLMEKIHEEEFDLFKTLYSYNTKNIKKELGANEILRATVYHYSDGFMIFVSKGEIIHFKLATALDNSRSKLKIPMIPYQRTFYMMDDLKAEKKKPIWSWSLIIEKNRICTSLPTDFLLMANKIYNYKKIFKISDSNWNVLLSTAGYY